MDYNRILIATDASENAGRAVAYVGEIIGRQPGFYIELLYILRNRDRDLFPTKQAWEDVRDMERQRAERGLEEHKRILIDKGIDQDSISTVIVEINEPSIAQAILKHRQEGKFGTIVVGRRGMSKAEEFLFGSVSNKIVHYAKDCAVWVIE